MKKGAPLELYRITDDPMERHNIAADHPDIFQRLDSLMWQLRSPSPNYPIEGE